MRKNKKEWDYGTDVNTCYLVAKNILLLWKVRLMDYTLLNWLASQLVWIYLETEVHDSDVDKLKNVRDYFSK